MRITSTQNAKVKFVRSLQRRRSRDLSRQFLVEGIQENRRLLESSLKIESCWFCPEIVSHQNGAQTILDELASNHEVELVEVSQRIFEKIAYRSSTGGIVTVVESPQWRLEDLSASDDALYLIVVGVEKPGNLGTMIRSCDAVGGSGLIVCNLATDAVNPNVIRASLGTIFHVPLAIATFEQVLHWAGTCKLDLIATSPAATKYYTEIDLTAACGLIIGEEHAGLPDEILASTKRTVSLPVEGRGDSLNAAMTATVLLFEAQRQRAVANG